MKAGNISQTVWGRSIKKQLHITRDEILIPPSMEESCTAVHIAEGYVPIYASAVVSGGAAELGIYAAAKAVNDLAARQGEPIGASLQIILPPSAAEAHLRGVISNVQDILTEAGTCLAGVKAETNPAVCQTFVSVTAVGQAKEGDMACACNAAPGQDIVLCGYVGLEGMLRILAERENELRTRFIPAFIREMKGLKRYLLALDAIKAAGNAKASAMLQIGSGGIFAALWELAEASGIGMEVELSKMSVRQETVEVCEYYNLNPYNMTSTGSFLMTAQDGDALVKVLEGVGARASRLGVATDRKARVITSGKEQRYLDRPAPDELMRWWEGNIHVTKD